MKDPSEEFKSLAHEFEHGYMAHAYQGQDVPDEVVKKVRAAFMCGAVVCGAMCMKAFSHLDIESLEKLKMELDEYGYQLYKADVTGGSLP